MALIKNVLSKKDINKEVVQAIIQLNQMKIYISCKPKPKMNLDKISGKNLLRNRLIRSVYKFAKSVTETSSKSRKPKTYNEVINIFIYRNK